MSPSPTLLTACKPVGKMVQGAQLFSTGMGYCIRCEQRGPLPGILPMIPPCQNGTDPQVILLLPSAALVFLT